MKKTLFILTIVMISQIFISAKKQSACLPYNWLYGLGASNSIPTKFQAGDWYLVINAGGSGSQIQMEVTYEYVLVHSDDDNAVLSFLDATWGADCVAFRYYGCLYQGI